MKNIYFSLFFFLYILTFNEGYCQSNKEINFLLDEAREDIKYKKYDLSIQKLNKIDITQKKMWPSQKYFILVAYFDAYFGLSNYADAYKSHASLKLLVNSEVIEKIPERDMKKRLIDQEIELSSLKSKLKDASPINEEINKNQGNKEDLSKNQETNEKVASFMVSGQGKSVDEAKNIALRSALELAFGTFISSKTEIFNDELIGDEIVSLTSGNIQNYKINSQAILPDGRYTVSLTATVSISKFTSFVESKGIVVEFKGGLFAENIKIQKLNEEAEYKAILNLCEVSDNLLKKSLDFKLDVKEPKIAESNADKYELQLIVSALPNDNFDSFKKYFLETIKSLGMQTNEMEAYKEINKDQYFLIIESDIDATYNWKLNNTSPAERNHNSSGMSPSEEARRWDNLKMKGDSVYLRSKKSGIAIQNLFLKSNQYLSMFKLNFVGLDSREVILCCESTNVSFSSQFLSTNDEWYLNKSHNIPFGSANQLERAFSLIGFPNFNFYSGNNDLMSRMGYNQKNPYQLSSWDVWKKVIANSSNYLKIAFLGNENRYSSIERLQFTPYFMYNEREEWRLSDIFFPIGKINFHKKEYLNHINFLFNLENLEKISSITVEPIN